MDTHTSALLDVAEAGGIARITLEQPQRRNPLSLQAMHEMTAALREIGASRRARVVILAASGPAFCAGHDLREMLGRSITEYRDIFDACVTLMETIGAIPQPVIAEVAGIATAAGCQLVATCDLAIASSDATFATPGVKIGLFCSTPMVALTRAVGRKRAMQMLLTGEFIDAATAADWGLINTVVPREDLRTTTDALARRIAASSALTVGIGKAAFTTQVELDTSKAYAYAKEVMSMNALADDAQEGIAAFLERRPPHWRDC